MSYELECVTQDGECPYIDTEAGCDECEYYPWDCTIWRDDERPKEVTE